MSEKQEIRRAFYRIGVEKNKKDGCYGERSTCEADGHIWDRLQQVCLVKEWQPVVTVCLLKDAEGNVAKGVSICSKNDSFDTDRGRFIAERRAIHALKKKETSSPIRYWKARENIRLIQFLSGETPWEFLQYKCEFNPKLTDQDEKSLRTASETVLI